MALMTNDGTERLGFLLHDAARLMRKRFEMRGSVYGLSAAQWRLLVRVVKDEASRRPAWQNCSRSSRSAYHG